MPPGRNCPLHYRYAPEELARCTPFDCRTLYVIGGLYGNTYALDAILALAAAEPGPVTLAFNGDFHWFDVDAPSFTRVNDIVLAHQALRGNVETELAAGSDTGCGCGYPEWVGDAEVERSNAIIEQLRHTAQASGEATRLRALPMFAVARIAGVRVGLVHGDAESLAGWQYSQESLASEDSRRRLADHFERTALCVIASSHTCLPVAVDCETTQGRCVLVNNGAAGMPNFRGHRYGVITRIATTPARGSLYGTQLGALHIDALPVRYDAEAWSAAFLTNWPPGSPAHASYYQRITSGPGYEVSAAARWTVTAG